MRQITHFTKKQFVYILSQGEEEVFRGYKSEVCDYLKVLSIEIDEAMKYGFNLKGYTISRELADKKESVDDKYMQVVENKEDKTLNYLIYHLKRYGNTCLGSMREQVVKDYIKKLSQRGLECRYKKKLSEGEHKAWYLIEVKK